MCRALAWQHLLNAILHMCMHRSMMLCMTMDSSKLALGGWNRCKLHSFTLIISPGGWIDVTFTSLLLSGTCTLTDRTRLLHKQQGLMLQQPQLLQVPGQQPVPAGAWRSRCHAAPCAPCCTPCLRARPLIPPLRAACR